MEKKRVIPVLVAIMLILIIAAIGIGSVLIKKYSYSKEEMDLNSYFGITDEDRAALLLGDEVLKEQAVIRDGGYYLPLSFVQEQLNSRFYYDSNEKLLIYTTPTDMYEIPVDSSSYTISGQAMSSELVIFILQDEVSYVELGFLKGFANFGVEIFRAPEHIQLVLAAENVQTCTVKKDTQVRYQGGIKSEILEQVKKGDSVTLLEQMETWSKVKTADSIIGYVENKRLEESGAKTISLETTFTEPVYTSMQREDKINMVWHQVTNPEANAGVDTLLAATKGVNTISPTWYFLSDNSGNFTTLADQAYVNNMHSRGIEVWALMDNFTNDVDISQILSTTSNRKNLIRQLVDSVLSYQIDGINIDFEQVPKEAGNDYIQFLRELSIACRKNELVLSVDNYVPTDYTAHYDRKEQGTVVDYVIIMGYDEHYSGSQEAGSVASIDYVAQGIENTVSLVPESKVINGVPFYTRLWKLADGVTAESLSMSAAQDVLVQHGVTPVWDDVTCQNYASYEADGATYQIWLEDVESLRAKLSVMSQYDLAGISAWKLGLEKPEVWDVITEYLANAQAAAKAADAQPAEQIIETN